MAAITIIRKKHVTVSSWPVVVLVVVQSTMAHFEPARPAMRRKSSAQNILASFKPPSAAALPPAAVPAVPLQPPSSISSVSGMAIASALSAASQSSSPALPLVRADTTPDAQYPDNLLFGTTSPPLGSSTSVEFLRDLVQKRLVTLTYIRNVHEGCVLSLSPSILP